MVVIMCVLICSGFAEACTPQTPSTGAAGAISPATPSQEPSPPSTPAGQPQAANASQAVNQLCLGQFDSICAGEEGEPDGSDVIYLGPGNDTAFVNALHELLDSSTVKALGPEPAFTIQRVPHSDADFTAASNAYTAAIPRLIAAGYHPTTSDPDIKAGTYDVALTSAPKGITTATATAYLQKTVSPLIVVTSVSAPQVEQFNDRGHEGVPFKGSDLVRNSGSGGFCSSGFSVIGPLGKPLGSTATHCNGNDHGNNAYTNGGYWVNGFDPAPDNPTRDSTNPIPFGTTLISVIVGDADMQLLSNTKSR